MQFLNFFCIADLRRDPPTQRDSGGTRYIGGMMAGPAMLLAGSERVPPDLKNMVATCKYTLFMNFSYLRYVIYR